MTNSPFRTVLPTQAWPAALGGQPARIAALLHQLEASQWWASERIRANQFRQLHALLAHAAQQVPFYRRLLREAGFDTSRELTPETWSRIPILTRHDVQAHGTRIDAGVVPPEHGDISELSTGGSTGVPVRIRGTALQMEVYGAALCREHKWRGDDPLDAVARISGEAGQLTPEQQAALDSPDGLQSDSFGPPLDWLYETGPVFRMGIHRSPADQVGFLAHNQAPTLSTLPSNLRLLLHHLRDNGIRLPHLRRVRTTSEIVDPALRDLCRAVTGAPIGDLYSSNDGGLLATQCPAHEHYHVAAESCLLEVLDDDGRPCAPGQTGRVVVTPLHNFATPLIRYEIGDRAEPGPPCSCGRGLPVLNRVVGKMHDQVLLADGSRRTLSAGHFLSTVVPVREYQLAQKTPGELEVRLVLARPLDPAEAAAIVAHMHARMGRTIVVHIVPCQHLPRTAAGKLRVFVNELPDT